MQIAIQVEIGNSLSDAMRARKMTNLRHGFARSALRIFRQWRPFLLAIAFLSCLGRASVALAQGPTISALAIDPATPTTLYAGTIGGAFKSTNGGDSWTAINNGLAPIPVLALAIDPATPTSLYAGIWFPPQHRRALRSGQRQLDAHEHAECTQRTSQSLCALPASSRSRPYDRPQLCSQLLAAPPAVVAVLRLTGGQTLSRSSKSACREGLALALNIGYTLPRPS
jgi:hypothetical protein